MSSSQASGQLKRSAQQQQHDHDEQQNQRLLKRKLPSTLKSPVNASGCSESDPTDGMANQRRRWTEEEEDTLILAVDKYGTGGWCNILKDPEFAPFLTGRTNINLKDKWRNLGCDTKSQAFADKVRAIKEKAQARNATTDAALSDAPRCGTSGAAAETAADAVEDCDVMREAVTSKKRSWGDDGLSLLVEEIVTFGVAYRKINGICAFFKREEEGSNRRMTIYTDLMEIEDLSKDKMRSVGENISAKMCAR